MAQILSGTIKATIGGVLLAFIGALSAGATSVLEPARLGGARRARHADVGVVHGDDVVHRRPHEQPDPAARHLRDAEHPALLPERRGVSGAGTARLAARRIAKLDPFTYAVHALRVLLLKGAAVSVLLPDLMFLGLFATMMLTGSVLLFRRTL